MISCLCLWQFSFVHQEVVRPPTWSELLCNLHTMGIFSTMYSWLLGRAAGSLEVLPGAEFRAAWVEGGKVSVLHLNRLPLARFALRPVAHYGRSGPLRASVIVP